MMGVGGVVGIFAALWWYRRKMRKRLRLREEGANTPIPANLRRFGRDGRVGQWMPGSITQIGTDLVWRADSDVASSRVVLGGALVFAERRHNAAIVRWQQADVLVFRNEAGGVEVASVASEADLIERHVSSPSTD